MPLPSNRPHPIRKERVADLLLCLVAFCQWVKGIVYVSNLELCASLSRRPPFASRWLAANKNDQTDNAFTVVSA